MSPDPESMFDFLDDEAANVTRARPVPAAGREERAERTLPIIRKPVPVSESGPLRAPSADAPRGTFDDDFDFLGERPGGYPPSHGTSAAAGTDPDRRGGRWRATLLVLGLALLAAGAIVAAWPYLPVDGLLGGTTERTADTATSGEAPTVADAAPTPAVEVTTPGPSIEPAPAPAGRSLGERFRDELEQIEALVADGRFDEAERALATMDRVVYGYGIAEFSALETRIAARGEEPPAGDVSALAGTGTVVERAVPERDAERARATEAERLEAERTAEQAALDAEAEQREAARREAEQLAAARREAERLADAERRAESERRAASETPVDAERDPSRRERLAAEREAREAEAARARAEAREAARRRAEALAAGGRPAPDDEGAAALAATPAVIDADAAATTAAAAAAAAAAEEAEEALRVADEREADRRATDRRIAEQRAAAAAEERRIAALESPAEPRRRAQIDDEDLQIVYASLLELKRAVEDRDIASVVALSDPPSGRVQQLLQIFANSASIRTRITNVSARPADDTVTGTLRIEDIRRADGSRIRTPPELESVALTSTRRGDGWSSLSW